MGETKPDKNGKTRKIYERDGQRYGSSKERYIRTEVRTADEIQRDLDAKTEKKRQDTEKKAEGDAMVGELLSDLKQADKAKKDREKAEQVKVDAERKAEDQRGQDLVKDFIAEDEASKKKKDEASKQRDAEGQAMVGELISDLGQADKNRKKAIADKKKKDAQAERDANKIRAENEREQKKTDGLMTQLDTLSKSLNNRLDQLDGAKAPKRREDLSKSVGRTFKRADIVATEETWHR